MFSLLLQFICYHNNRSLYCVQNFITWRIMLGLGLASGLKVATFPVREYGMIRKTKQKYLVKIEE